MAFQFVLCDDDPDFISAFTPMLQNLCMEKSMEYELSICQDIPSLAQLLGSDAQIDLIFLDIFVGDGNGMEFARDLRKNEVITDIVFISCSGDYGIEGYDVKPLHYLLKPIVPAKLEISLARFKEKHTPKKVVLHVSTGVISLTVSEVLYLESYGHNISIHTLNGSIIPYYGSLKELELLLRIHSFVRTHKSYLINLAHVTGIDSRKIYLSNGQHFPITRAKYKEFQANLVEYADHSNSF